MATDRNALRWTSADVLSDVRRKASLPTTSTDWSDAVILREATDVLWSFAGWAVAHGGEGRLLSSLDRPVTAALGSSYRLGGEVMLPPLAIASTVESVVFVSEAGGELRLTRIDAAVQSDYDAPSAEGEPMAYALVGDRIRLYPRPNAGGAVRITYQRRHPELVLDDPAYVGTISSVAAVTSATSALTLSVAQPTLIPGDTVDVLRGSYPYAPIVASAEVTATAAGGATITLDQPLGVLSGHDIAQARLVRAGHSPYVQLPLELRTCLAEKTAANILRAMGDMQGMQAAEQSATMELTRVMQMLSPRGKRDKPRAVNPYSHLRLRLRG